MICGTRSGVNKARRINRPEHVLVAPLDADPGSMRWPAGPGVTVLPMGAPKEFVLRLVQALLSDGCELVVVISEGRASIHQRLKTENEIGN